MSAPRHRHTIRAAVDAFFIGWSQRDWRPAIPVVAADAALLSNQHPLAFGPQGYANALAHDAGHGPFFMRTSNHYVGGDNTAAVASAYAFGLIEGKQSQCCGLICPDTSIGGKYTI